MSDMRIKTVHAIKGYPYVSVPSGIFQKGDRVLVVERDDQSVIITKDLPKVT